jgi:hypothetical protein
MNSHAMAEPFHHCLCYSSHELATLAMCRKLMGFPILPESHAERFHSKYLQPLFPRQAIGTLLRLCSLRNEVCRISLVEFWHLFNRNINGLTQSALESPLDSRDGLWVKLCFPDLKKKHVCTYGGISWPISPFVATAKGRRCAIAEQESRHNDNRHTLGNLGKPKPVHEQYQHQ